MSIRHHINGKFMESDSWKIQITIAYCPDFLMFTMSSFKNIENKHDVYTGKDCMKKVLGIFKKARNEDN